MSSSALETKNQRHSTARVFARSWLAATGVLVLTLLLTLRRLSVANEKLRATQHELSKAKHTPSPYEERFPGWSLPTHAQKANSPQISVPKEKETCLVHVGKTAGSAVGCSLGFQLHCYTTIAKRRKYLIFDETIKERAPILPGVLPQYTTHTFHREVNDCPEDPSFYLFVVRNPLDRVKSAYAYDRITSREQDKYDKALLYLDCPFQTLNDLAEKGLASDTSHAASPVCQQRARDALLGRVQYGIHLYYNYGYYANATLTNTKTKVLVLRTEHLAQDWNAVEHYLGGTKETADFPVRNSGKHKTDQDNYLSEQAQTLACAALCREIQVYKDILQRAVNLDAAQRTESLENLRASCPLETDQTTCPS